MSLRFSLFGCCFGFVLIFPAIRGCPDASGGEHGDRWSVLITTLTFPWIRSPVDILLQSGDRRDIRTGGYFDPTSLHSVSVDLVGLLLHSVSVDLVGLLLHSVSVDLVGLLLHSVSVDLVDCGCDPVVSLVRHANTKETLSEWTEELCICGGLTSAIYAIYEPTSVEVWARLWRPNFPGVHPSKGYSRSSTLNSLNLLGLATIQNA
uniref:Uncharacterized protein n=1 Tax=Ananas comosus var. bracteatus TaxID=296719 RepID=A0A6V7PHM6_ANACO|nr:unnamed protein product [Ananas comosus var. bracteatus]